MQELNTEVTRLHEANSVAATSIRVVPGLEREIADAPAQSVCVSATWRTEAEEDCYMLHAEVRDRTCLLILLDAERKKRQDLERSIADLWRWIINHLAVVDTGIKDIHSTVRCGIGSLCSPA